MPRIPSFLLVMFALTLWLGAAQHCNLKAAGFWPKSTVDETKKVDDSGTGEDDATDPCESIENGAFLDVMSDTDLVMPADLICETLSFAELVVTKPADEFAAVYLSLACRECEWLPDWHFQRRAAPPSRAPAWLAA